MLSYWVKGWCPGQKRKEIPVRTTFTSGFTSHPEPFVCSIRPRSDASEALIFQGEI
ncbi:hypothetical protein JB92DRAFT_2924622 [Gautieria morchelliformis]|nr:hypothetical protein JB92DRAFT_2924622 [Gautieria morchelliformis]